MEAIEKKANRINKLKWAGIPLGMLMSYVTAEAFGMVPSVLLGVLACVTFVVICIYGSKTVICERIIEDLKLVLIGMKLNECVFEIKVLPKNLMILRVYMLKSDADPGMCSKLILDRIKGSWYHAYVKIAQIAEVDSEADIPRMAKIFNAQLKLKVFEARERTEKRKRKELLDQLDENSRKLIEDIKKEHWDDELQPEGKEDCKGKEKTEDLKK